MKKFEYKELRFQIKYRTFKRPHFIIEEDYLRVLNEEGKKGWEAVHIQSLNGNGYSQEEVILMKREIDTGEKSFF
jgi:hypothetical protein